jgi:hypothetical protein
MIIAKSVEGSLGVEAGMQQKFHADGYGTIHRVQKMNDESVVVGLMRFAVHKIEQ